MADEAVIDETPPQQQAWVHVAVLGGETQQLDYEPGMTVGEVLTRAEITRQNGTQVTVNGEIANDDQVVEANSTVQITGRVKNG